MNEIKKQNGITLIALIITIIIMLILVAVSVIIAIKGNIFGIAKSGAKQITIESYKEHLEVIRVNAIMEQIKNNLTTVEFMDKVEEGIVANKVFEERQNIKKTSKSVKVTTKEGYLFKITENKVMYMGLADEQGELTLDLVTDKNTFFTYNPSTPSRGPVIVSIDISIDEEEMGAILEYSIDGGSTWQEYTEGVALENNGDKIYARLYSEEEDEIGSFAIGNVTNIDRLSPKSFTPTGTSTGYSITLVGNTEDAEATSTNGSSGIKAYYYSIDNGNTWMPTEGTKEESYTFENLQDNTTYNGLKMKAVDNAGNEIETNAITIATKKVPKPEIGDYVDYQPDDASSYTLSKTYSGYSSNQTISQERLDWQILKIHDDGSIDLIGLPTTKTIYFSGALGYNNGVYLLHDICEKLYSKPSQGIKARSVSLEDFEDEGNKENWIAERDAYTDSNGIKYGETKTFEESKKSYYPNIYAEENGSGINTTAVKTNGIKDTNKYYTTPTTENYSQASTSGLTATQTYYCIEINETNCGKAAELLATHVAAKDYWIASRYVNWHERVGSYFGLRTCGWSSVDRSSLFCSTGTAETSGNFLRPVVTLSSNVKLELTGEGIDNDASNPHKIINY